MKLYIWPRYFKECGKFSSILIIALVDIFIPASDGMQLGVFFKTADHLWVRCVKIKAPTREGYSSQKVI